MKQDYMRSLALSLIETRSYIPAKDESKKYIIKEDLIILQKQDPGKLSVIELLDGDSLDIEKTVYLLEQKRKSLLELEFNGHVNICQIFIYNSSPSRDKLEAIKNGQYQGYPGKRLLSCYTISLETGEVNRHFNFSPPDKRLESILQASFNKQGATVDDIVEAAQKKLGELTIDVKTNKPVVSYAILTVNIAVWLLSYAYSQFKGINYGEILINLGAKDNYKIMAGEYWRFVTPVFLHVDMIHVLLNSYSLFYIGPLVERLYGSIKFAVVYLIGGVCGNIASFLFSMNTGVGASGAIFGLMGSLLYFGVENRAIFKRYFGGSIIKVLIINLIYGFLTPGIDNFAHLGGLFGGFFASGAVGLSDKGSKNLHKIIFWIFIILAILTGLFFGFNNMNNRLIFS